MEDRESSYWTSLTRQRFSRRTVLRGTGMAGAGLAAAALIGCGSDDEKSTPTSAATAAGTAGASATPAKKVSNGKPGGRLSITQAGDPPSFDLHQESTTYTNATTSMAYNQLVQFDPASGDEAPTDIVPDLATEWEISPDGMKYTFHLTKGVKFHDGSPFTSADVKASLDRQENPPKDLIAPPRGAQIQWIKSVDTPDDNTVVINANRPVSSLSVLPILGQGWMAIYPAKAIAAGFDHKAKPNGTGPYIFQSYDQGSKVSYNKNPNYFVPNRPFFDGVDMYIIPDLSTTLANFQAGKLNIYAANKKDTETLKGSLGDKITSQDGIKSLGFDVINYGGIAPWTDVRVRQAMTMAMNKQAAIDVLYFGDGRLGGYMNPGGFWALSDAEMQKIPGYTPFKDSDITEARKMLDAAGVPAQRDVRLLTRQGPSFEPFSLYIKDQIAKLGMNGSLDVQETAKAYDTMSKKDFDLAPWNHGIALDDPDAIFAEFYNTGSPRNYSQVSSKTLDDAWLKQSQELDPEKRKALVIQLQKDSIAIYGKTLTKWSTGHTLLWKQVQDYVAHVAPYNNNRWENIWFNA